MYACSDDGDICEIGKCSSIDIIEPALHRSEAKVCDNFRPAVDQGRPEGPQDSDTTCAKDIDCKDGVNGRCVPGQIGGYCTYDLCSQDSECENACYCEGKTITLEGNREDYGNRCVTGNCRIDADCGDNYCSPSFGECGKYSGVVGYYCHTLVDECRDDSQCPGTQCRFLIELGHWTCGGSSCSG